MPPESKNSFPPVNNSLQEEPPHKHTRLVLLTIVMILIGVLAVVYFWYQNKQTPVLVENQDLTVASSTNEFADWKTYRNEEYGFEFEYPGEWDIKEESSAIVFYFDAHKNNPYVEIPHPLISVLNINSVDAESWLKSDEKYASQYANFDKKSFIIGGIQGISLEEKFSCGSDYIVVKDKKLILFQSNNPECVNKPELFEKIISTFNFVEQSNVSFELRSPKVPFGDPNYYDAEIVQINKNGTETILLKSIKQSLPELQERDNFTLEKLSFPQGSSKLYFYSFYSETDFHPVNVYAFDLNTRTFDKLYTITKYYANWGEKSVSPNGKYIATLDDPDNPNEKQKIFLLDLENNSVKTIVSVSGKESITFCSPKGDCWGNGSQGNLKWIDNKTLQYAVYDSSRSNDNDFGDYLFIENRKVIVD